MNNFKQVMDFIRYSGFFDETPQVMADLVLRTAGVNSPELAITAALTVKLLLQNHICLQLDQYAGKTIQSDNNSMTLELPGCQEWINALKNPELFPGIMYLPDAQAAVPPTLMILDNCGGCYLQRQWSFERSIASNLLRRAECVLDLPDMAPGKLHGMISFFPTAQIHPATDYQQLALAAAMRRKLLVLSGGPGTGKTTVAATLLALKLEQNPDLRIMLAAPTAKAAATLNNSISSNIQQLNTLPEIRSKLQQLSAGTIHRLLKYRVNSNDFAFNSSNPLPCDLLLLDECSMIPQSLMARLLEALSPDAGLIMLGDKHQLSSVEAGSVLADICSAAPPNCCDQAVAELFASQTTWQVATAAEKTFQQMPLTGALLELTENHRFAANASKLGEIAGLIRNLADGESAARHAADQIASMQGDEFHFCQMDENALKKFLKNAVEQIRLPEGECFADLPQLAAAGNKNSLDKAFNLLDSLVLLSPGYQGKYGIDNLNKIISQILHLSGNQADGTPILILQNNYRTGLFNGDIGLIERDENQRKRVFFPILNRAEISGDTIAGNYRTYSPDDLPEHSTVFAMSVHKSQGCGFDEVIFIMPGTANELMTREMVYTAMTRARKKLCCIGSEEVLAQALARPTSRMSNLSKRLVRS